MTTEEFNTVIEPYLTRKPEGPGDPEVSLSLPHAAERAVCISLPTHPAPRPQAYVMWQMFANDAMKYAGDVNENEKYFSRTTKTIKQRVEHGSAMAPISYAERQAATQAAFANQCGFDDDTRAAAAGAPA